MNRFHHQAHDLLPAAGLTVPQQVKQSLFSIEQRSRPGKETWHVFRTLDQSGGPAQATVATAHLIARVVYRMLKYQVEYEPLSVSEYEKRYHDRQVKYLEKKAAKFGFQLMPVAT